MPLVIRKHVVKFVSTSWLFEQLFYYLRWSIIGVAVLFADSLQRSYSIQADIRAHKLAVQDGDHHHHLHADADAVLKSKLFYAQRNMYITGFTMLLAIVLNRVFNLQKEVMKYKERSSVVTKQAENNSKTLGDLMDDKTKAETEVKELKAKLAALEKAAKDAEVVKKQANSNYSQYMELSDKHNALEARVKRVAEEHGIPLDVMLGKGDAKDESSEAVRRRSAAGKKDE
ncbi:B-cell receptor-associated protein 31-like-domain-containing protein [Catenaria anguillulae PL171]|uniref:Endoplasmic reticulum transmembrane protein n=1 Tax=Catenaria anguillulae PL171 TaxID=765915 RepID=A0A1Y2I3U0_9FUNG|nr:B-cell receptor-associated protein 31-like-domain-containing protein [Catenaria anguillulae PL171]